MKKLYLVCITFFLWNNICAQNTGDTIIIQTFIHDAWTDGNGNSTGSGARDTIAYFPTDTNITFEKIIMSYNMRCKDNNNSNPGGNSRVGCGAWDYSCQTYVHDSTRIDSILHKTISHTITGFNDSIYNYSITPVYNYFYIIDSSGTIMIDTIISPSDTVTTFGISSFPGTLTHDVIDTIATSIYWQPYSYTYDTSGAIINIDTLIFNGTINITDLIYYKRYPMAFQIMSFVTPYGMGVNFGEFGESWYFDVTDFTPVLQGPKRMTISGGGQWQEDLDVKFLFIVGTPPKDVLEMQQIWRPQSKGYSTIMSDGAFEPRSNIMLPNASSYKIRSVITGHGQDGEFFPRTHYLNVDGANPPTSSWQVWTECADNPVYPQGGTWIYDRAGWCPGQPTDLKELDITTLVNPGQTHTFDYGVTSAGSSNYWVNNQLVSYSNPNFSLDATISEVLSPNDNIEFSRKNPICSNPKVLIQNTGSTALTSLDIEYWINNSLIPQSYSWSGNLDFLEEAEVELPVSPSFWQSLDSTQNVFYVKVMNPNGGVDEYSYNDLRESNFTPTPIYPSFFGLCIQTNSGTSLPFISETSWDIYDASGNTIYTSGSLSWGTQYRDSILLSPGCYRFEVKDTDDDGLDFWANNDGSGVIRFLTTPISCNAPPVNYFEADFGKYIFHEFRVVSTTALENLEDYPWKIYPNPTNGILSIQGLSNYNNSLRIYNKLGKLILYEKLNFEGVIAKQIDISQLPAGIYFVHIEGSKEKVIKKLVKL